MFDQPITSVACRRSLGFLPEQPYFYDYLNGLEYLELAARLSGLDARAARRSSTEWLARVGLGDRPRLVLRKYSKGMLQRLGLAAALVHGPELLILDEPMSGLDPFGRRDVRELILEQRERGTTILFSSHILPDVEMLCDRVFIILGGRLVRSATLSDLMAHGAHAVEIRCVGSPVVEIPPVWRATLVRHEHADGTAFLLSDPAALDDVVQWLMRHGIGLRAVTPQRASLEELFMAAASEPAAASADGSAPKAAAAGVS
jgi:ABC-2 type transport system ATP-binding protein